MRRLWLSAAAAAILASPAIAADTPVKVPLLKTSPPVISTWTGCYLGGNAGWFGARQTAETVPLSNDGIFGETTTSHNLGGSGAIGGAYAGCNWQTGQMVIGGEGDFEFLRRNDSNTQFSAETLGAPPGIPNYIATRALVTTGWALCADALALPRDSGCSTRPAVRPGREPPMMCWSLEYRQLRRVPTRTSLPLR